MIVVFDVCTPTVTNVPQFLIDLAYPRPLTGWVPYADYQVCDLPLWLLCIGHILSAPECCGVSSLSMHQRDGHASVKEMRKVVLHVVPVFDACIWGLHVCVAG